MKRSAGSRSRKTEDKIVSAYRDDALGNLDATALAEKIAAGDISTAEAVRAAIERAESVNARLNAIVTDIYDLAVKRTEAGLSGPFAGVPTFVKDTDDVTGAPTRFGSRTVPVKIKNRDSMFIRQFLSAGFVCLGKTTLPEFGLTATTEPLLSGATRNPWNTDYSTSGSSGGSGALVAAGVVPIAHGNDGGGSIRNPAACCGLVGLKPTRGRLKPMEGVERMPVGIVHQGVLTRTVRDTAGFYSAAERYYRNPGLPGIGSLNRPGKKRLRIGMYTDRIDRSASHPETTDLTLKTGALCEKLGHKVELIGNPFDKGFVNDFLIYWGMMAFAIRYTGKLMIDRNFDGTKVENWTQGLISMFRKNILKTPSVIKRMKNFRGLYDALFQNYDLLLCPTVGHPVPEIGHLAPDLPFEIALERITQFSSFTPANNVSGAPAISLPLGFCSNDLPMGMQFSARWGMEKTLLEIAFELEEARPWPLIGAKR